MNDTQNEVIERTSCEYCREMIDVKPINDDIIPVSIDMINTLSGAHNRKLIHLCDEHVPDAIHQQGGPYHFAFDTATCRVTGGMVWREGEYPYETSISPEQFPDRILGLAMIVQQGINGRGDF